jgi:hypothetical protein
MMIVLYNDQETGWDVYGFTDAVLSGPHLTEAECNLVCGASSSSSASSSSASSSGSSSSSASSLSSS